jgi:hypothetical protein
LSACPATETPAATAAAMMPMIVNRSFITLLK